MYILSIIFIGKRIGVEPNCGCNIFTAFIQVLTVFVNTFRATAHYCYTCSIILLTASLFFYIYSTCICFGIYYKVMF